MIFIQILPLFFHFHTNTPPIASNSSYKYSPYFIQILPLFHTNTPPIGRQLFEKTKLANRKRIKRTYKRFKHSLRERQGTVLYHLDWYRIF